jgi:predicted DNA-binding protein
MRQQGNNWAVTITLDQATVDRLDWFTEDTGATKSATIRLAVEERYNRLHPAEGEPTELGV